MQFRKIETDILRELSEKSSRVVSTGGGVPVRETQPSNYAKQRGHHTFDGNPGNDSQKGLQRDKAETGHCVRFWAMTPQSNGSPICWLSEPRHIRAPTDP